MKQHILPALKLTLVCLLFFCGVYTLFILAYRPGGAGNGEKGKP